MAIPTAAQVRTISLTSAWASVPDATIEAAVEEAATQYTGLVALDEHTRIVALAALHILWMMGLGVDSGAAGPVVSASAGAVSASFGVAAIEWLEGPDMSSPYGRRLLAILATLGPTMRAGGLMPWTA